MWGILAVQINRKRRACAMQRARGLELRRGKFRKFFRFIPRQHDAYLRVARALTNRIVSKMTLLKTSFLIVQRTSLQALWISVCDGPTIKYDAYVARRRGFPLGTRTANARA